MKLLLSTLLATTIAGSAAIADPDWSGLYAGASYSSESGYGDWYNPTFNPDFPMSGSLYGGFAGYNMQNGAFVYGGELAYQVGEVVFDWSSNTH